MGAPEALSVQWAVGSGQRTAAFSYRLSAVSNSTALRWNGSRRRSAFSHRRNSNSPYGELRYRSADEDEDEIEDDSAALRGRFMSGLGAGDRVDRPRPIWASATDFGARCETNPFCGSLCDGFGSHTEARRHEERLRREGMQLRVAWSRVTDGRRQPSALSIPQLSAASYQPPATNNDRGATSHEQLPPGACARALSAP
jgi:hypothetical protein